MTGMRSPLTLVALAPFVALALAGCGGSEPAPPATVTVTAPPAAAAPSSSSAPAGPVVIPTGLDGKNGAIVLDELERAGFTNVQPASADEADRVVINAANWTVTKVEPGEGETVASDSVVVVTMTKQG